MRGENGGISRPLNIVFLIFFKAAIRNTVVLLPALSQALRCATSFLWKPYLCNWPLRIRPTCWLSRFFSSFFFRTLQSHCLVVRAVFTTQALGVIRFQLECLTVSTPASCFSVAWSGGSLSQSARNPQPLITFFVLMYKLPWCQSGCSWAAEMTRVSSCLGSFWRDGDRQFPSCTISH